MRKIIFFCLLVPFFVQAQDRKDSTFYEQQKSFSDILPVTSDDIIFLGNSITNGVEGNKLFNCKHIKNRGISGDITEGVYDRLDKTAVQILPSYPISKGISAPFTGIHNEMLIIGGGCNFPDKPASEGGKKVFYNQVYALNISGTTNDAKWTECSPLPFNAAYGASAYTKEGIIWIGGQNESSSLSEVFFIQYNHKEKDITYTSLPSLPVKLYNGSVTILNNKVYISGGVSSDNEKCDLFFLDLSKIKKGWKRIKTNYSYNRQQSVLISYNQDILLAGGYDDKVPEVFSDILKFDFNKNEWIKYSDIKDKGNHPSSFVGASGVKYKDQLLFTGGVNYTIFSNALHHLYENEEYMNHIPEWYQFNKFLQIYNPKNKQWNYSEECNLLARAGAGVLLWKDKIFIVCGEIKPGIRTNEVSAIDLCTFLNLPLK